MKFSDWLKQEEVLTEAESRYSVEVNYRTKTEEVLKNAAKITLGYASAALKRDDFHVKQVFEENPLRLMVSSRAWDDGEWVGVVSWNPDHKRYVVAKGFYNKDRKSVSIPKEGHVEWCEGQSAAEIANSIRNMMHDLKDKPDRHVEKLKSAPLKRGPK